MQNQSETPGPEWTILKLLKWTTDFFKSYGLESPRIEAELLLAHALGLERIDLYLRYDQPLTRHELAVFKGLIKRRAAREPAAYILGIKEFWSMALTVNRNVLIPRPETECLVEAVISSLAPAPPSEPKRILDLGTGCGAIALALAFQEPFHVYYASDFSEKTLVTARQNAERHHLSDKVHFFCSDWMDAFPEHTPLFDIIVSNPPYVKTAIIETLQPEIIQYEPLQALDGGKDGLDCLRHIVGVAHTFLRPGGGLFLEIGHDQKDAMQTIIAQCGGYTQAVFTKDYSGYDRMVQMRKE